MGWCGVLECGIGAPQLPSPGGVSWDVWMPHPHLQKKKLGLHPTTLVPAFLSLHHTQTESNPDMRNSKLAHTQAGF